MLKNGNINPGPRLHIITDHMTAREFFFYLSSSPVSIEIFTSNLGNFCSLFYTDHFLTIVEICLQNKSFFYLFTKDFACLAVVNAIKMG